MSAEGREQDMKKVLASIVFIMISTGFWALAQNPVLPDSIHEYQAPIDMDLFLAGNFGELRNNHFHAGLDFKTHLSFAWEDSPNITESYAGGIHMFYTAYTFIVSGAPSWGDAIPSNIQFVKSASTTGKAGNIIITSEEDHEAWLDVDVEFPALYSGTLNGSLGDGKRYRVGYLVRYNTWTQLTGYTVTSHNLKNTATVLVPPDISGINKTFVRIGKNGIQIFLGDGFYFTAANRGSSGGGPIIAIGGKTAGGQIKCMKVDSLGFTLPS